MESSLDRSQKLGVKQIIDIDEVVGNAATISKIAVKTGLTPNQLIEMYQMPDVQKTDVKTMAKDFDNGKGVQKIQEAHQKFTQDRESLGKSGEEEARREDLEVAQADETPIKESWVKKLGLEDKRGKAIENEGGIDI